MTSAGRVRSSPAPSRDPPIVEPLLGTPGTPIDLARDPLPPRLRTGATLSILDITKYFGPTTGGIRTYLMEKARYVEAHPELRQVLVVPGERSDVFQSPGVRGYRFKAPRIPLQRQYRFFADARAIQRVIDHERPDLIEVGSPFLVPWMARRANRVRRAAMVWFYHGSLVRLAAPRSAVDPTRQQWRQAAARRYVVKVSRLFDAVVVASESAAAELEALGVTPLIRVSLGVDLERFHPRNRMRREGTRRELGWAAGPIALYMGRLAHEKQLDLALRAWPSIERVSGARLAIMGDGPAARMLRRLPGADRILWLPHVADRAKVADIVAAADLYLAPGPVETFGLAALEAMASGVPVLSVDAGAVPELVRKSEAGECYQAGNSSSLEAQALHLLGEDLVAMGMRGRAYAQAHHAWPDVLQPLFQAYRAIVDR